MNIIVAADRHWAIGKDGRGLVTIPADQQMLMRETAGKVVVMGRKTLEGLPGGQPLGNRVNVVLSRNEDYKVKSGMTIYQYILHLRLNAAEDMIKNGVSVISASQQCGFGDYSNYYRCFKKEYGVAPREYFKRREG